MKLNDGQSTLKVVQMDTYMYINIYKLKRESDKKRE